MEAVVEKRIRSWWAGLAIIVVAIGFVTVRLWTQGCGFPAVLEAAVLMVVPLVYMTLMYLTLASE